MYTAADLELVKSTSTAKFESDMQARVESAYLKFTVQDTYGAEGFVPTMLGGIAAGGVWAGARAFSELDEYGIRYMGHVYGNAVSRKKEALRVSPVQTSAKIAAALARDAAGFSHEKIVSMLKANVSGFDREPLFGAHSYAAGGPVYENVIGGTNAPWFLLSEDSFIEATAEDYHLQVYGGENTEIDFMQDSVAFGWRAVKLFAPGFWPSSVRSEAGLTSANLRAAMNRQIGFKNDKGRPMSQRAKYLVVGTENSGQAEALIKAALVDGGNTNLDLGRLEMIVLDTLDI